MTTHTQLTPGRPVTTPAAGHYIRRDHTVIGTADQIANLINHHRDAGTLIAATTPCPLTGGRFQTTIWVRVPVPARPTTLGQQSRIRTRRPRRRTRIAVMVTAVTGTLAGLVALAAYLLGQLVELIAAHAGLILGALALAAILAGLSTRRSSGRRHCPGC